MIIVKNKIGEKVEGEYYDYRLPYDTVYELKQLATVAVCSVVILALSGVGWHKHKKPSA